VRLSGRPPIGIDGLTLDPELQLLLALRKLRGGGGLRAETHAQARARMRRETLRYAGDVEPVRSARDLAIAGAAGTLRARHYAPEEAGGPHPLLVFFHGGGFAVGDLDTHDAACRALCRGAGVHVLSVDYRLAPEHPFPAAADDAYAALRWAIEHASALGADASRVGVGGDSAGGNLASVAMQLAARDGGRPAAYQLLIYPVADRAVDRPSIARFAEGFVLESKDVAWFTDLYLGEDRRAAADPRAAPLRAKDLSGLAPGLIVTAGFDPLRDEGEAYAHALREAGTPTTLWRYDGLVHGFANMIGVSHVCRRAVDEIVAGLRALSRGTLPAPR
jgi:acetyl esterase